MNEPSRALPRILWGVLILILAGTAGAFLGTRYLWSDLVPRRVDSRDLPDYGSIADFTLTNQQGRAVSRADFDGQPWVADFIFTRCAGPCPLLTAQMARVADSLGVQSPVRFASFSVDPERDTPETLARYAENYGADASRWHFLTGPRNVISNLAIGSFHLGMGDPTTAADSRGSAESESAPAEPDAGAFYDIPHSLRFALVDANGKIRGYYDGTDPAAVHNLYQDIGALTRGSALP
jgi:protein SCO1/2